MRGLLKRFIQTTACIDKMLFQEGKRNDRFVDLLRVRVRAGKGGDGAASFERSATMSRGRPRGGDGGSGGNVIVQVDPSLDSLHHVSKNIMAESGERGGSNLRMGRSGKDFVIKVPVGTEITEVEEENKVEEEEQEEYADLSAENNEVINNLNADSSDTVVVEGGRKKHVMAAMEKMNLSQINIDTIDDKPVIVAKGGRGGRGNYTFGMNNHECELGQPGEDRLIQLNLKTIADVGLVGLPNAGKSSFLKAVSNAHPRIAPYPFTTLNPHIGIIEYSRGRRVSVADIPGLIEGAHCNKGLGHAFLKHVVKARILVLVVDFAQSAPQKDIQILLNELECYQNGLSGRCKLVIANKADLLEANALMERIQNCKQLFPQLHFLPISALHSLAITKVTTEILNLVDTR